MIYTIVPPPRYTAALDGLHTLPDISTYTGRLVRPESVLLAFENIPIPYRISDGQKFAGSVKNVPLPCVEEALSVLKHTITIRPHRTALPKA